MCFHKSRIINISLFNNVIFSHRSNLAAAINALSNLGIGLDSDKGIATQQCRIAILLHALAATEYVLLDNRRTGFSSSDGKSNRHHAIPFHTADLTAAIDGTFHRAVTDADSRSFIRRFVHDVSASIIRINFAHHGLRTQECSSNASIFCNTLAASEHITFNSHAFEVCATNGYAFVFYHIGCCVVILVCADIHIRVACDVSFISSAIHITCDIGALYCFFLVNHRLFVSG